MGGRELAVHLLSGLVPYGRALRLQEKLADARHAGRIVDTLLVLQHPPVYTVGKRATVHNILKSSEELQRIGAEVHHTARGGDVTWHGPGQAVVYPIVNVRELGVGARAYVEGLEDTMINAAADYGVKAYGRATDETGVWVGDRKIGAVGVRISKGISSHGLAFNVNPDLSYFEHIVPCGIVGKGVTSLAQETAQPPSHIDAQISLAKHFLSIFKYDQVQWHETIDFGDQDELTSKQP